LQRFTLATRALLLVGFVAPGLTKVAGKAFAPGIDPAGPMGAYFVAMHEIGAYYAFVGIAQVVAGALLLSRRTALAGALLYLPIIANIFVLTVATRFGGTQGVTGLMLLAALWLVVWDGHRLVPIFSPSAQVPVRAEEPALWDLLRPKHASPIGTAILRAAVGVGMLGLLAFTLAARGLGPFAVGPSFLIGCAGGVLALVGWALAFRRRRRSALA
jgi:hypothetical protein